MSGTTSTDINQNRVDVLGVSVDNSTTWTTSPPAASNVLNTTTFTGANRSITRALNLLATQVTNAGNSTDGFASRFNTVIGNEIGADQTAFTAIGSNLIQAVYDLTLGVGTSGITQGDLDAAIAAHDTDANAHSDIRSLISGLVISGGGGAAVWGQVTGTLGDQGDLNNALNAKQDALVSGTSIKTINGTSLLGSGDMVITGGGGGGGTWGSITGTLASQTDLQNALNTAGSNAAWGSISGTLANQGDVSAAINAKQDALVSGASIKTINGTTLLGAGDITISTPTLAWGNITGTLASQTDLQSALDAKLSGNQTITLSGAVTGSGTTAITTSLSNSGVTAGTYQGLTVDAAGRVTGATNQSYLTANQAITLSGDVTGTGATAISATLSNSGVTAGTYQGITVDAKGRVTAATAQSYLTSAVTNVATGTGLSGGPITATGTISLANTAVTAGTYQGLTVDAQGRITAATNQNYITGNQAITLSGDVTGSGATAITATVVQAPKLTTARTITISPTATTAASFDGTANVTAGVSVTTAAGTPANTLPATAATALQSWLVTARNCLDWLIARAGGMPTGGTTGQVLTKKSATDFDTEWRTSAAGGEGYTIWQSEGMPWFWRVTANPFGTAHAIAFVRGAYGPPGGFCLTSDFRVWNNPSASTSINQGWTDRGVSAVSFATGYIGACQQRSESSSGTVIFFNKSTTALRVVDGSFTGNWGAPTQTSVTLAGLPSGYDVIAMWASWNVILVICNNKIYRCTDTTASPLLFSVIDHAALDTSITTKTRVFVMRDRDDRNHYYAVVYGTAPANAAAYYSSRTNTWTAFTTPSNHSGTANSFVVFVDGTIGCKLAGNYYRSNPATPTTLVLRYGGITASYRLVTWSGEAPCFMPSAASSSYQCEAYKNRTVESVTQPFTATGASFAYPSEYFSSGDSWASNMDDRPGTPFPVYVPSSANTSGLLGAVSAYSRQTNVQLFNDRRSFTAITEATAWFTGTPAPDYDAATLTQPLPPELDEEDWPNRKDQSYRPATGTSPQKITTWAVGKPH